MDCVKICLKSKSNGMTVLSCRSIVENDGVLTLTLNGIYATITVSDSILFDLVTKSRELIINNKK